MQHGDHHTSKSFTRVPIKKKFRKRLKLQIVYFVVKTKNRPRFGDNNEVRGYCVFRNRVSLILRRIRFNLKKDFVENLCYGRGVVDRSSRNGFRSSLASKKQHLLFFHFLSASQSPLAQLFASNFIRSKSKPNQLSKHFPNLDIPIDTFRISLPHVRAFPSKIHSPRWTFLQNLSF